MAFKIKKPKVKKDEMAFFVDGKWRIYKAKPKAKKGEIVEWKGDKYKVGVVSWITHTELLIGGERAKPNWYYQLEPLDPESEEVGGWVNEARIKLVKDWKDLPIEVITSKGKHYPEYRSKNRR